MLDYAGLEALSAVVREGSFERAARKLHVTPSAVSQRIKLLEERVGQVLVLRGTPCVGTEAGQRLCLHVEQVSLLENDLRRSLPGLAQDENAEPPTLKLAVNADSLTLWFMDAVARFTQGGNELLDISIDDQDYTAQRLKSGEVLAAVTATSRSIAGCRSVLLGSMRYVAAASPAFMARYFQDGVTAQSLLKAPVLTYDRKDSLQDKWVDANGLHSRRAPPKHWLPSAYGFVKACEAGVGWGVQPALLIKQQLQDGSLVVLMEDRPMLVPLYWAHARMASPALERLTACVEQAARLWLEPVQDEPS